VHQNKGDSLKGGERLKGCRGKLKRPQINSEKILCEKRFAKRNHLKNYAINTGLVVRRATSGSKDLVKKEVSR